MRVPALLSIAAILAAPLLAQASVNCSAPDAPQFATAFSTENEANTAKTALVAFLGGVDSYKQCLASARDAYGTSITPAESSDLQSLTDSVNTTMAAVTAEFSQAFQAFRSHSQTQSE